MTDMTDRLVIVGAGLAGLIAACMLQHRRPIVVEAQTELPNNHRAVLRFGSSIVGDVLGIQFKRVKLVKFAIPWRNPVADALAYAKKTTGTYSSARSIATRAAEVGDRWIAPSDLIPRMAERIEVRLGVTFDFPIDHPKVVSTIPMPSLMKALDYPRHVDFEYRAGWVTRARVAGCDAFATVLVPDPTVEFYRASITGDELIVESTMEPIDHEPLVKATRMLGLNLEDVECAETVRMPYGKITAIDEKERRDFIYWASNLAGRAHSLGRFACWRPGLVNDDLVKDVRLIDQWLSSPTPSWEMEKHRMKERST